MTIADCGLRIADCRLRIADCGLQIVRQRRIADGEVWSSFPSCGCGGSRSQVALGNALGIEALLLFFRDQVYVALSGYSNGDQVGRVGEAKRNPPDALSSLCSLCSLRSKNTHRRERRERRGAQSGAMAKNVLSLRSSATSAALRWGLLKI